MKDQRQMATLVTGKRRPILSNLARFVFIHKTRQLILEMEDGQAALAVTVGLGGTLVDRCQCLKTSFCHHW